MNESSIDWRPADLHAIWRSFRAQRLAWQLAMPVCLVLAGVAEGIGLTFLLPLTIALSMPDGNALARCERF